MDNNNNQHSFMQFSDELRLHTSGLANLSLNDSIWSSSFVSKRSQDRRNFDVRVGGELSSNSCNNNGFINNNLKGKSGSDLNGLNNIYNNSFISNNNNINYGVGPIGPIHQITGTHKSLSINDVLFNNINSYNNGSYSKGIKNIENNFNVNYKFSGGKGIDDHGAFGNKISKKNNYNNVSNKKNNKGGVDSGDNCKENNDKRLKTLPPAEALRRNETVGGYIFVCNNDTMQENLKRQLFGLPPRYRDSVRQITPGLPLFLYNYSTHQLHGVFEAASFGGANIDPTAWEDKKSPGESRFPAQVKVVTRKVYEPLEEDSFRPILHHYDGPKFRLELNVPEALSLLDEFAQQDQGVA